MYVIEKVSNEDFLSDMVISLYVWMTDSTKGGELNLEFLIF